jgi:outer membrane lipopolysaccharide assembly protein LptE/RlpB
MSRILSIKDLILISVFFIFLNGCGYELRSQSKILSNQTIELISKDSELNKELERQLKLMNNNLQKISIEPDLVLKITDHKIERYVGSIGLGARTTQVRLDYLIKYEATTDDLDQINNEFSDSRYIDFNQSNLLAFEKEVEITTENVVKRALKNMEFFLASQNNEIK